MKGGCLAAMKQKQEAICMMTTQPWTTNNSTTQLWQNHHHDRVKQMWCQSSFDQKHPRRPWRGRKCLCHLHGTQTNTRSALMWTRNPLCFLCLECTVHWPTQPTMPNLSYNMFRHKKDDEVIHVTFYICSWNHDVQLAKNKTTYCVYFEGYWIWN
jgi:hypothetical protein